MLIKIITFEHVKIKEAKTIYIKEETQEITIENGKDIELFGSKKK